MAYTNRGVSKGPQDWTPGKLGDMTLDACAAFLTPLILYDDQDIRDGQVVHERKEAD